MNLTGRPPFTKGQKRRRRQSKAEIEDEAFREWIRRQPSCISGRFNEFVNGEGRCVAAHVSRIANGKGIAIKPLFSCVPLTQAEHLLQSQHGYEYFHPKEWWDAQIEKYVAALK